MTTEEGCIELLLLCLLGLLLAGEDEYIRSTIRMKARRESRIEIMERMRARFKLGLDFSG